MNAPTSPRPGRLWLWLAVLAMFGGLIAAAVQYGVFKHLGMPWYAPVLAIVAVLAMIVAFQKRPAIVRGFILGFFVVLAAFQWVGIVYFTQLPAYSGPARVGESVPAFTTTLAGGTTFSDSDLRRGERSVLLFFRGRW